MTLVTMLIGAAIAGALVMLFVIVAAFNVRRMLEERRRTALGQRIIERVREYSCSVPSVPIVLGAGVSHGYGPCKVR